MTNGYNSMCFCRSKLLMVPLAALILVLTYLNTVSVRYLDSQCNQLKVQCNAQGINNDAGFCFDRCTVLQSEIATQLHTHG